MYIKTLLFLWESGNPRTLTLTLASDVSKTITVVDATTTKAQIEAALLPLQVVATKVVTADGYVWLIAYPNALNTDLLTVAVSTGDVPISNSSSYTQPVVRSQSDLAAIGVGVIAGMFVARGL